MSKDTTKGQFPFISWGSRGTAPVSDPKKNKYCGNTMCSSLRIPQKERIVIDAGTGIIEMGRQLENEEKGKPRDIHLLLTHFHLDHIMGLPFFPLLYSPETTITFYSPLPLKETKKYLSGLMAERYFPIDFQDTPSQKIIRTVPPETFRIGRVEIDSFPLHHPQGCLAYRFQFAGKTLVFSTDTEHPEKGVDKELAAFCRDADILVYDATFTPEDYLDKKGWGHSTWLAGTELAAEAGVKSLFLSHFNPDYDDQKIDGIILSAREKFTRTFAAGKKDQIK